ncbi:alpha/beta hydrolase [Blastomonas aquatica]|uniref:Alpha/beta hydrolase n=2 Tax=Blastomonas aquatica TaxID=1510276 RepID=A0ABQ1J3C1_9SPHN|nr:alpha/beta hydrolase [Blastomonas aquatica]
MSKSPFGKFNSSRGGTVAGAIGMLAGTAVLNRLLADRAEHKHPQIGSLVWVDGVPVHYLERGSGSPIVLVHGVGSLIQDFVTSGLMDMLAQSHRVIAFDRPGYGYTPRPRKTDWTPEEQANLLVGACTALGIAKPMVVGHSWGTLVALGWALEHPDRISSLALLSGYYYPTSRPDSALMAVLGSPVFGDVWGNTLAPLQSRLTGPLGNKMVFSPASPTDTFLSEMPFELILRPSQLRATAKDSGQMPASAARLSKRYGELKLPISIVWGDGDKLVKQGDQSAKLAIQLPHASAIEMEGVGHMVHHTDPQAVASAIEALARQSG